VLELSNRSIVGNTSRVAGGFDLHAPGFPVVVDYFEHLRLPTPIVGLGHNPESAVTDFDFFCHVVCKDMSDEGARSLTRRSPTSGQLNT